VEDILRLSYPLFDNGYDIRDNSAAKITFWELHGKAPIPGGTFLLFFVPLTLTQLSEPRNPRLALLRSLDDFEQICQSNHEVRSGSTAVFVLLNKVDVLKADLARGISIRSVFPEAPLLARSAGDGEVTEVVDYIKKQFVQKHGGPDAGALRFYTLTAFDVAAVRTIETEMEAFLVKRAQERHAAQLQGRGTERRDVASNFGRKSDD